MEVPMGQWLRGMTYISAVVCSLLLVPVGAFRVGCEQEPTTEIGRSVTLECSFDCNGQCTPAVKWEKNPGSEILYEYKESKSDFSNQHANYSKRIEVDENSINNGKAFLTLKNVHLWDEGDYVFFVSTDGGYGEASVHLPVWASTDGIHVSWDSDSDILSCQSSGWYPAPEVTWKDRHGNALTVHNEIKLRESDGYFNVTNDLKVIDKMNHYICSMKHNWMDKPKQTRVIFSDGKHLIRVDNGEKPSDL
ncbi:V-set domain-containing T-cell activation inhibitor 1 isoform X1 [Mobula hypostoma]|uniref:V-set domain-containing T-cell activation inhibitor 1 isoform X1 n=2 Tax=Mobula hypostoma TaxID=723540 RepID=UPI002FC2D95E